MPLVARLALVCLLLSPSAAFAAPPWDTPFADPSAVAEEAARIAAEPGGITFLLYEEVVAIDERGLVSRMHRLVVRLDSAEAIANFGDIELAWSPWREDRPEARFRVVGPDGSSRDADLDRFEEQAAPESNIHSDRRTVHAPWPGLRVGSVVESWIRRREIRRWSELGRFWEFDLRDAGGPWSERRAVLRVPADSPLILREVGLPAGAKTDQTEEGIRELTWTLPAGTSDPAWEDEPAFDAQPGPVVRISTARSWQELAAEYERVVEAVIATGTGGARAAEAVAGLAGTRDRAEGLVSWMSERVRYGGLEFGKSGRVPAPPHVTLDRGFGDCKDQAALLVALLRSAGIEARLALLRVGDWFDVDPAVPGLEGFDHLVVRVGGDEPFWIDPTSRHTPVGLLPIEAQGRRALVIDRETTGLIRTPVHGPALNQVVMEWEIRLQDDALADLDLRVRAQDGASAHLREVLDGRNRRERRAILGRLLADACTGATLKEYWYDPPADPRAPFELRLQGVGCSLGFADGDEGAARIDPAALLLLSDRSLYEQAAPPRVLPRALPGSILHESHFVFRFPPGFVVRSVPATRRGQLGPASWSLSVGQARGEDLQSVEAHLRFSFDTPPDRSLGAQEFNELRSALARLAASDSVIVPAQHQVQSLLEAGRPAEAVRAAVRLRRAHPDSMMAWVRETRALTDFGLTAAARVAADRAVELGPRSLRAWAEASNAHAVGHFGRDRANGWSRERVLECQGGAMEIDPEHWDLRRAMAVALAHSPGGVWLGPGADLEGALAQLDSIPPGSPARSPILRDQLRFHLGRFDELTDAPEPEAGSTYRFAARVLREGAAEALRGSDLRLGDPGLTGELARDAVFRLAIAGHYSAAVGLLDELPARGLPPLEAARNRFTRSAALFERRAAPEEHRTALRWWEDALLGGAAGERDRLLATAVRRELEGRASLRDELKHLAVLSSFPGDDFEQVPRSVVRYELAAGEWTTLPIDDTRLVVRWEDPEVPPAVDYLLIREHSELRVVGTSEMPVALGLALADQIERAADPEAFAAAILALQGHTHSRLRTAARIFGDRPPGSELPLLAGLLRCDEVRSCLEFIEAVPPRSDEQAARALRGFRAGLLSAAEDGEQLVELALEESKPEFVLKWLIRAVELGAADGDEIDAYLDGLPPWDPARPEEGRVPDLDVWVAAARLDRDAVQRLSAPEGVLQWPAAVAQWRLLVGLADERTEEYVERAAVELGPSSTVRSARAWLEAVRGHPSAAMDVLRGRPALLPGPLAAQELLVLGLVAEQLGLPESATAYYDAIRPARWSRVLSSRGVADRRLEALRAPVDSSPGGGPGS